MSEKGNPASVVTETGKEQSTRDVLKFSSVAPCTVCRFHWDCTDKMRCLAYCRHTILEFERIGRDEPILQRLRYCRDAILNLGKKGLDR